MSIKIVKINNQLVEPIQTDHKIDKRPLAGEELFTEEFANIYIVARKKSGKTNCINKIVRECATNETTIIVFCSTLYKDDNHIAIKKYCKKKGIPYVGYESMKDDAGVDRLKVIIQDLQNKAREENESSSESEDEWGKSNKIVLFESSDEEEPKKRNKYRAPEFLIILDDVSDELKSNVLTKLTKENRHFRSKLVISTQYCNDLLPASIKQMNYILLFKGQSEDKLLKLYEDSGITFDFRIFKKIYNDATSQKYNFLYIDTVNQEFRKNFSKKYVISKELLEMNKE